MMIPSFYQLVISLLLCLNHTICGLVVVSPCCNTIPHRLSDLGGFSNSIVSLSNVEVVFAVPPQACTSNDILNSIDWYGKVVFIERGMCNFTTKILTAQNAGAAAVVIYNNIHSDINGIMMTGDVEHAREISIPAVFISKRSARLLKDAQRLLSINRDNMDLAVIVSLNATGSFSPQKIELRGVEELTRYVIVIFLCFLLACTMGGLLVLLVSMWRSRAIGNLTHYPFRSGDVVAAVIANGEHSARDTIKRFLTTVHEYSPEFVTYLVQRAGPSLLRDLQNMAVLPIGDAVSSFARMIASSSTEASATDVNKSVDSLSTVAAAPPDTVQSVVTSLVSVYTEFACRMASSGSLQMKTRTVEKLNSTVATLRYLMSSSSFKNEVTSSVQSVATITSDSSNISIPFITSRNRCEVCCTICLDDIVQGSMVTELPCKHIYHRSCIEPWLESRSLECPLCKSPAIHRDSSDTALINVLAPLISFLSSTWCLLLIFGLACCFLVSASIGMLVPQSILIPPGTVRVLPYNSEASGH